MQMIMKPLTYALGGLVAVLGLSLAPSAAPSSSRPIWVLIEGWETRSFSEALRSPPSRATHQK